MRDTLQISDRIARSLVTLAVAIWSRSYTSRSISSSASPSDQMRLGSSVSETETSLVATTSTETWWRAKMSKTLERKPASFFF